MPNPARQSELALIVGFLAVIAAVPVTQTALELVRQMGLYTSQEEYDQDLRWFKNIR